MNKLNNYEISLLDRVWRIIKETGMFPNLTAEEQRIYDSVTKDNK